MNIGIITQPNEKGQIVIPKKIRDSLGINKNVPLKVVQRDNGIFLYPIKGYITNIDTDKSAYLKILEKTQGAWAGDDWPETEKRRRKIELAASKRRKAAWW